MGSIRQGISHFISEPAKDGKRYDLTIDQVISLIDIDGLLHLSEITEKTDGQTFMMGFDDDGFWTQNSGSGDNRMRRGHDYVARAVQRGNSIKAASAFSSFHDALNMNDDLLAFLEKHPSPIRGELFNNIMARECEKHPGFVKFVHTSYDPQKIGALGSFIIHSKLPENQNINLIKFKELSNEVIKFDDDFVDVESRCIDFWDELKLIIAARQDGNMYEFERIKRNMYEDIIVCIADMKISPKWGYDTEGWIIHPPSHLPDGTRFKIISKEFKEAKSNGWKR